MTGDIDESDILLSLGEIGEREVYGNATLFLFFERITLKAVQCFDNGCFPMVDVTAGTYDVARHLMLCER